ncbi:hypothetical protein [Mesorhizobium sp.]|uniref:hypothetical protein n=1 Tax=Mesorhizobium sp. TaxID=1871066 RepID=UPI0025BD94E6|nr:hypothetical protein [Mesorhizobium sp.]
MVTVYNDDGREARYSCSYEATTYGGPRCQSISARPVDTCVTALMLEALSPSAIDVSLQLPRISNSNGSNCTKAGSSDWNARTMKRRSRADATKLSILTP